MPKPNAQDLITWAEREWHDSSARRAKDQEMDDVFFSRHSVELKVAENIEPIEHKTSLAADTVIRLKSMVRSRPPLFNFHIGTMNMADQRLAEELDAWTAALWDKLRYNYDVWDAQVEDMIRLRAGVSIVEYVPAAWGNWPVRDKDESDEDYQLRIQDYTQNAGLPISWRHVPSSEFVPVFGDGRGVRGGFWYGYRRARDIVDQYGRKVPLLNDRLAQGKVNPTDKVKFITYADNRYMAYLVGDLRDTSDEVRPAYDQPSTLDTVRIFEHPVGAVPFIYMRGMQTSSPDPVLESLSALYFLAPQIKNLDNIRTARTTMLHNFIMFPPLIVKLKSDNLGLTSPTGEDREQRDISWKQGGTVTLWDDEDLFWLQHPGISSSVDSEIALIQGEIARLGIAPQELADPAMSGVARSIAIQISASKFGAYTGSMTIAVKEIIERWVTIAKHILMNPKAPKNLSLHVDSFAAKSGSLSISKGHLIKPLRVQVNIPTPIKPDMLALMQMVTAARQGPFPFLPDSMLYEEIMGYTNPGEILDLLLSQEWQRDPDVRKVIRAEVVRRLNMQLDAEDLQAAMAMAMPTEEQIPPALTAAINAPQPMAGPMITGRPAGQMQNQQNITTQMGLPV